MRDDNHRHTFLGQRLHHAQHFTDHFRIEGRGWLVEQHDRRLHRQRPGDGHALLLSAGELVRVGIDLVEQADLVQQGVRPFVGLHRAETAHLHRCQRDVLHDGLVREEVEALKDHADFRTQGVDVGAVVVHRNAVHQNAPARGFFQPVQAAQEGAFPRTRGANDTNDFGRADSAIDAAQHAQAAEVLGQAFNAYHLVHSESPVSLLPRRGPASKSST